MSKMNLEACNADDRELLLGFARTWVRWASCGGKEEGKEVEQGK